MGLASAQKLHVNQLSRTGGIALGTPPPLPPPHKASGTVTRKKKTSTKNKRDYDQVSHFLQQSSLSLSTIYLPAARRIWERDARLSTPKISRDAER